MHKVSVANVNYKTYIIIQDLNNIKCAIVIVTREEVTDQWHNMIVQIKIWRKTPLKGRLTFLNFFQFWAVQLFFKQNLT